MSPYKNIFWAFLAFMILFNFSLEVKNLRIEENDKENTKGKEKEENEEEEKIKDKEKGDEEKTDVNPPKFSKISGFYPDNFKLKLISEENYEIYYTDDSSDPRTSQTSQKYKDYILIYDKSPEPNIYSSIGQNDSSPVSVCIMRNFRVPNYPVDKAMIIRAVTKNTEGNLVK